MIDTKEARSQLRLAKTSLASIIDRNEQLERALERACTMLEEAKKYVGENAYVYSTGSNPTSCRKKIGDDIALLRSILDA